MNEKIAEGYYAHVKNEIYEAIRPFITGKSVLDCGCVGNSPEWHDFMKAASSEYVGVDLQNEIGLSGIVVDNVETVNLKRKFDAVLAGDMLALVDNQGLFLDNMRKHLKEGGILIVTHSNCSSLRYRLRGSPFDGFDKACKHNAKTISGLLSRHGFDVFKTQFFAETSSTFKRRLLKPIFRLKPGLRDWILIAAKKNG